MRQQCLDHRHYCHPCGHSMCRRHHTESQHVQRTSRAPVFLPSTPLCLRAEQRFGENSAVCWQHTEFWQPLHVFFTHLHHKEDEQFVCRCHWLPDAVCDPFSVSSILRTECKLLSREIQTAQALQAPVVLAYDTVCLQLSGCHHLYAVTLPEGWWKTCFLLRRECRVL